MCVKRRKQPEERSIGKSSEKALQEVLTAGRAPEKAKFNGTQLSVGCSGNSAQSSRVLFVRSEQRSCKTLPFGFGHSHARSHNDLFTAGSM